jgi:hypothetical protein
MMSSVTRKTVGRVIGRSFMVVPLGDRCPSGVSLERIEKRIEREKGWRVPLRGP